MSAPAEPQPETDQTNAPSARSDRDETHSADAPSSASAVLGFGPPAASGEVGTLGPYRVVKELGKGGMGAVYAAIDTRLDRRLALKVMLPQYAADAGAKERFLREAKAAAKIKHDNVVVVYEADERNGVPYIAMEFLEGYPLDQYLKTKGRPTIPQIIRIASETAAGLAAAHKHALVHRDIKPGNLWLEAPHGRVKVLDFGLAKPVDAEAELTKSGVVVGTPAYMSPEQAKAEKVDHRTDLFSLGSVLYRLCAGKLPFQGATTMAVLMALGIDEPKPVRELNPDVPESLAALIHQLLSKRADARPQSAAEVVNRLRAIAEELAAPRALPAEQSTSQPQLMQPQVVYAVMPVTAAPPEQNPFADLDSPDTEAESGELSESAVAPAGPKPAREKSSAGWLWPAVGFAALLVLVVGGVIVIIKNKDGTATKAEPPDTTAKDKDGKTVAPVGPGKTPPVADTDVDRTAAVWVIGLGGTVRVNGEAADRKAVPELPKERFTLTFVNLSNTKVTDAGMARLASLNGLTTVWLDGTGVTDAGLARLKDLRGLTALRLNRTAVTDAGLAHIAVHTGLTYLEFEWTSVADAGLAHLKDLARLEWFALRGTQVTDTGLAHLKGLKCLKIFHVAETRVSDAGLEHLKELKGLTYLDVQRTSVTAKGLEALHAALPGCQIQHDGGIIEPIDVDRKAAEWVIGLGGFVRINNEAKDRKAAADLPKERFTLTHVNLNSKAVPDAGLAHLKELKGLTSLSLNSTPVSDAGLEHLKDLKSLTQLGLGGAPVSDAGVAHLKDLNALTHLTLGGAKVSDVGAEHLKGFPRLTYLGLDGTKVSDAAVPHLKQCKGLTYLNVKRTAVTTKGLEALAAALPACRITHDGGVIEPIDVDRKAAEWVIDQGGFVQVNGKAPNLKVAPDLPKERFALTWVHLNNTKVTDAGVVHLKDCRGLTNLELANTSVTDAALAHLTELKSLVILRLDGTKVSDAGLVHLKGLKTLATLSLQSTQVSDGGLGHLKELKGLTDLWLNDTQVSDAGLAHLQELKGLTSLGLNRTKVSDAGLTQLREIKSLQELALDGTTVSDAGLAHLKECKGLTRLDVRKTQVTAKGRADFHAAVPGCKIVHDGGIIEPKK